MNNQKQKTFFLLLIIPIISFAQLDTSQIYNSPFIEESFVNYDSLDLIDCVLYSKDNSKFSGTAFLVDYRNYYYFIKNDLDKPKVLLKIISFKNGLKYGSSKIIDPILGVVIHESNFEENFPISISNQYLFKYADFRIEYGDLGTYIIFKRPKIYTIDWDELSDHHSKYLGDDESMSIFNNKLYINKLLLVTTKLSYGRVGEQYGHYESDSENYLYGFPPNYCGEKVIITEVEIKP